MSEPIFKSHSRSVAAAVAGVSFVLITVGIAHAQSSKPADEDPQSQKKPRLTLLDRITLSASRIDEAAIDALAAESHIDKEQIERTQANSVADVVRAVPGVAASANGDDPATSINIRGMEQSGRVVVTLDGARQDYWRVGHGSGSFYIEPELLKEVTVIRGPSSNSFGSGGVGGVVAFETIDASDFLGDEETWALNERLGYETNGRGFTTSTTGAYRFSEDADVLGNLVYRERQAYKDGNGALVPWTGEQVVSGMLKGSFRPADGHEIKLGMIRQYYDDYITASSGSPSARLSRYAADTSNETYTASYSYKPENELIDFKINAYHNNTRADQFQVWSLANFGNTRYYEVATTGVNATNSSRFDGLGFENTLTYGADYYHLVGKSDANHFGAGIQDAAGGFLQWKGERDEWLEVIAALRYDAYSLRGQDRALTWQNLSGDRWSPRVSVGVTPITGLQFYGAYSEGYRAPTVQDVFRGGGSHGAANNYVPNLLLQPEVAKSIEAGVNIKYNDVLAIDDALRAKINVFDTRVEDYIEVDLTNPLRTAANLGDARLRGLEFEGTYDANWAFFSASGALIDAKFTSGVYKGQALNNTPLNRFSATLGFRALEEQLVFGAQLLHVGEITRTRRSNPAAAPVTNSDFQLVNLFADWTVNEHTKLGFAVENLFDEKYTDPQAGWSTSALTEQGKGRTFKFTISGRLGG